MGKKEQLFLIFIFMVFLTSWNPCTSKDFSELELLQSVKSSFDDPNGCLSTWNSSLNYCHWHGVSCDGFSSRVTKIELSGKNLSGRVPEAIFQFQHVETIDVSNNQLFGAIPGNLSSCLSLKHLNVSDNNFTGPLPTEGSNPILQTLDLANNMFSGEIPENIGRFSGLRFLDFGGNLLQGRIPKSIKNMSSLEFFTLASNQLSGEIPPELGLMKSLKLIYLGYNNFSGRIPEEIDGLTSLNHLDLVNNNLTGGIPASLGNLTNLNYIFLYLNKLNGPVPESIFGLESLISLDLSDNFLSGKIPEAISQMHSLEVLHLFSNNFTGKIPNALSSLPHLKVLQLWSNQFSGQIPPHLGKRNNLTILDLSTNSLTGKIPENICQSGQLFKLILFSNSLQGPIPKGLSHCKSLQRIRIERNKLSGQFPPDFTSLPLVYFLDISENNLVGTIKNGRKWSMPELQMLNLAKNKFSGEVPDSFGSSKLQNLDLSGNGLSGSIPPSFGTFSELVELKLNDNKLSGEIPDEVSSCQALVILDLSHNQLSGKIPTSLSKMGVLGQLDLSVNQLSGEIPPNLGNNVGSLVQVNLSHNHFHGSLPSTGAFLAIDSSALVGNNLCGGEKTTGLPPCKRSRNPAWWLFLTCLLFTILVAFVTILLVTMRRNQALQLDPKKVENEDGTWEVQFFSSMALKKVSAVDIFSSIKEENLISRGKEGSATYKGVANRSDTKFVTKWFSDTSSFPATYWTELEGLGRNINHPNIVKLLAACKSENGLILVCDYVQGKVLSEAIGELSWDGRQKVAIGIARAIRYLHSCSSPSIQVGEISTRRIIVDVDDEPHLISSFPHAFTNCVNTRSLVSSALVAPETSYHKTVTRENDIYEFGLLLIELLTGKGSVDTKFGLHGSIVEWARYCYSDCCIEAWIDPNMKADGVDQSENQIVEIMNLALQCTASDPSARPRSIDVAKALESAVTTSRYGSCALGFASFNKFF